MAEYSSKWITKPSALDLLVKHKEENKMTKDNYIMIALASVCYPAVAILAWNLISKFYGF